MFLQLFSRVFHNSDTSVHGSIEKVNAHFYFLSDVYVRLVLQVHLVLHEFIHFVRLILQTERLLLQKMHLVLQRVRLLLQ